MAEVKKELKPCPFCGRSIDIEKDVYEPSRDWHPTLMDPDSGGDPINIHCECGLEFCTGTHDWGEFVKAWNRRANDVINNMSTAYDVDKVVEQLKERSKEYNSGVRLHGKPEEIRTDEAIEIVKGGGVDGN